MKREMSALDELRASVLTRNMLHSVFSDDQLREVGHIIPTNDGPKGKKRGAPRGNQYARKHGLYSRLAPAPRRGDMARAHAMKNLTDDIAVVRLMLANLLEDPEKNMQHIIQLFRLLTQMHKANDPVASAEAEAQEILDYYR